MKKPDGKLLILTEIYLFERLSPWKFLSIPMEKLG
jgi:hypothetical protein